MRNKEIPVVVTKSFNQYRTSSNHTFFKFVKDYLILSMYISTQLIARLFKNLIHYQ
jgi:hypothetical protein